MRVVLRSLVFIHHVEVARAVFIKGLRAALLEVLHLVVRAFNPVSNHRAAHQADHGRHGPATAIANSVTGGTPRQGAHQRPSPRLGCLRHDGLIAAYLTRHSHLLHHRRAGNNPRQNVHGQCGQGSQAGCSDSGPGERFKKCVFHDVNLFLSSCLAIYP